MITESIKRLKILCDLIPNYLTRINEEEFCFKLNPNKWSKKEILGHLIDSAANNYQRFVRAQFENIPAISYDQNNWNTFSYHNQTDSRQLIEFWTSYNKQIIELFKHIPEENLKRKCIAGGNKVTLEFIINDYVTHLEHHLKQIINYD
jgi:hypothetical protein